MANATAHVVVEETKTVNLSLSEEEASLLLAVLTNYVAGRVMAPGMPLSAVRTALRSVGTRPARLRNTNTFRPGGYTTNGKYINGGYFYSIAALEPQQEELEEDEDEWAPPKADSPATTKGTTPLIDAFNKATF